MPEGSWAPGWWQHLHASGDDVIAVDHEVDVTDGAAIARAVADAAPDAVYHLAALTHVGQSWNDPAEVFRVNTIGTLQVLEAARKCRAPSHRPSHELRRGVRGGGPRRASGVGVGTPRHRSLRMRPAKWRPSTPPSTSISPTDCRSSGCVPSTTSARARVRDSSSPPWRSASSQARREQSSSIAVGNLSARRDITDVRDVVRAYRLLVEHGTAGEVYNVCSGHDVSIDEIAQRLLQLAAVELELVGDPDLMRPVDVPVVRGDRSRLVAATGWQPQYVLDRTLFDVLSYWDEQRS